MRVHPRRGRTRSASEVARSRLRGLTHAPQSQPCFDSPVSGLRGLPHAPQSQPRFFTTTSLSGSSYSPAVTLFFLSLSGMIQMEGKPWYIFTSAPNERVLRVTQLAKLSFNHPFALQSSSPYDWSTRSELYPEAETAKEQPGCTHTEIAHTRQRRQNTTASPRLRRGAGRCCCSAAAAAAAAVLLLSCCCFTTRDASRSTNRHNRLLFLVLCF